MLKFLHILKEQTTKKKVKKICCQKSKFKMATKLKMAAKTKFAYVAEKTFVGFRTKENNKNIWKLQHQKIKKLEVPKKNQNDR
jgi:hypothetical protein